MKTDLVAAALAGISAVSLLLAAILVYVAIKW